MNQATELLKEIYESEHSYNPRSVSIIIMMYLYLNQVDNVNQIFTMKDGSELHYSNGTLRAVP
jgi:hypothetical protein